MRPILAVFAVLVIASSTTTPTRAQLPLPRNFRNINRQLAGTIVDYTNNHGRDCRIFSPILGQRRDMYVYLPPGYNPRCSYPLVLFLHMAVVDERAFLDRRAIQDLDEMIVEGTIPPMVFACPDGTYGEKNRLRSPHSFFLNGCGGRFEDHLLDEIIPFLQTHFAIRPGRESVGLLGISAGGLGAMSIGIRHRDRIGAVATIGAPLNLRYSNVSGDYFEDFDPCRYRWKTDYNPDEVVSRYYHGVLKSRAHRMIAPVFGEDAGTVLRIMAVNPADLLFSAELHDGELPMYVAYSGRSEWNFDAQAESFLWLAASRGIRPTVVYDPNGHHNSRYFRRSTPPAIRWIGSILR